MIAEILLSVGNGKKEQLYREPFLFDPNDANIIYAYRSQATNSIIIHLGMGGEISITFNQEIWDRLVDRFANKGNKMGFKKDS